ncbi:malonyl-coenzyme A:anthocyanin 3-O-glucoside-6''-O-malonyltransferase-like [Apium graveolens]|uniref:malonyl-coenzyme A:anthocyanin 3-O-glucoside-6''-O-malonyltransferase-like n=1 Tax=Apium graveolens TaxID=4045 RepID=UPI003D78EADF
MASNTPILKVIGHCQVSPPSGTVAQNYMPLTFFDLLWLDFSPFSRLLFYHLNISLTDFTQIHVPSLKNSLSLALQHYFPLAGNLLIPTTCDHDSASVAKPSIRYLDGDSVSFTVAEYDADFIRLTGNQSRDFNDLSCLAPQLPPAIKERLLDDGCEVQVSPVLAIQVTCCPGQGICIGFTSSHAVADGSTIFNFIRAWGLISKSTMNISDDAPSMMLKNSQLFSLPFYDRSVIEDPKNLAGTYLSQMGENYSSQTSPTLAPPPAPAKKVRATFVLNQSDIEALKKLVSTKLPRLSHISSFTVACGYTWSCLAKTQKAIDSNEEDEEEHLIVAVNCRARLDPPVSETYFGNCLTICFITTKNSELIGEENEGLIKAAELIGQSIHKKMNEDGILKGAEMWYEEFKEVKTKWKRERITGIAGSPKFYFYNIDFGWGNPKKYEFVSEKLSISGCKDAQGDIEFGLCLTENEMMGFSAIFGEGLHNLD